MGDGWAWAGYSEEMRPKDDFDTWKDVRPLKVYTDGACSPKSGRGGWAWAVEGGPERFGGVLRTTNNRMELLAVIKALGYLDDEMPLEIFSDSQYVVHCFQRSWWQKWEDEGWADRLNADLWQESLKLLRDREAPTTFWWVRGHSGDPMNEYVDALAVKGRTSL